MNTVGKCTGGHIHRVTPDIFHFHTFYIIFCHMARNRTDVKLHTGVALADFPCHRLNQPVIVFLRIACRRKRYPVSSVYYVSRCEHAHRYGVAAGNDRHPGTASRFRYYIGFPLVYLCFHISFGIRNGNLFFISRRSIRSKASFKVIEYPVGFILYLILDIIIPSDICGRFRLDIDMDSVAGFYLKRFFCFKCNIQRYAEWHKGTGKTGC